MLLLFTSSLDIQIGDARGGGEGRVRGGGEGRKKEGREREREST